MKNKLFVLFLLAIGRERVSSVHRSECRGAASTVRQVQGARLGSYVALTGHIVAHQRSDYFTFRDKTGEICVEVESPAWQGRAVTPETKVRLLGEVDSGFAGRYLWVKPLEILE